ncbi:MAG: hypothetical protein ACRD4S_12430 [Candidatus Acidiferrales bacterium]
MAHPTQADLREIILRTANAQQPRGYGGPTLQQNSLLNAVALELGIRQDPEVEEAILTQWHDLFRTGYFAWGLNLSNPNPPFFHFTDRGRRALERLSRDPGNPAGYLRHLAEVSRLNSIAHSYLGEALDCFVAGFYKAAAVMVGGAAESIILELPDIASRNLATAKQPEPKGLSDWRVKTILDALHGLLDSRKGAFPRELREEFEAYWMPFAQQIRSTRNDAGHPSSVDPVTEEDVHASLLIFPEMTRLSNNLAAWMDPDLK